MSRILLTGNNQITYTYEKHIVNVAAGTAWAKGIDMVKYKSQVDKIKAHSAGRVIKVIDYLSGTNGVPDNEGMGYGNYVMILHENNYVTLYAHLETVYVKEGIQVKQGDVLGLMGNTGSSYGAHLHFEIRKYKSEPAGNLHDVSTYEWINPTPYLESDLPKETEQKAYERVQAGSFTVKANAMRRANELKKKGFDAIIKLYNGNYRVQVGAYQNHSNAVAMMEKLKTAGYADAYITTESGEESGEDIAI